MAKRTIGIRKKHTPISLHAVAAEPIDLQDGPFQGQNPIDILNAQNLIRSLIQ